jgi:hypothetical protein
MTQHYALMILRGSTSPEYVTSIGPFESSLAAAEALEREGLAFAPCDGEWAKVVPDSHQEASTEARAD